MKNYTITVNGNVYNVTVEENGESAPVVQSVKPAVKQPSVPQSPAVVKTADAGGVKVEAPMTGKILAIKASAGQSVKKGDLLMVLEAMKMENDIVAPEDGTVASINVSVGNSVESGDVLATLS